MAVARENINVRIAQYDDGLQFNLLSLCCSPLRSIPEQLASILHSISAVEKTLNTVLPHWKAFLESDDEDPQPPHNEPNDSFALSKELIANSYASDSVLRELKAAASDPSTLLEIRRDLLSEQVRLQAAYVAEAATIGNENEQAARRKIDYTPVIYNSVKELAKQGVLKEIVRDLVDGGNMKQ
jgi:ubiquitin carboxyl-terminal hydrolase L5